MPTGSGKPKETKVVPGSEGKVGWGSEGKEGEGSEGKFLSEDGKI